MANEITVTSYFALLLLRLQEYLKEQVPQIKWIDQDFGQLENYEVRPPVQFPCLLVDLSSTQYDMYLEQVQHATATVNLRLGFAPYSSANSEAPVKYRQEALDYYEIEQQVYKAMQGWDAGELCQPFTRTLAVTEGRDDKLRVRQLTFTTAFEDHSASLQFEKVQPEMTIDVHD